MYNHFYASIRPRSQVVVILLWVGIGIDVLNIFINLIQLFFFPDMGARELSTAETILGLAALGASLISIAVFVATAVIFLMWLHRAYRNLSVFSNHTTEASPGWAVGYWFIPFINLYKPLKVVNEVWHASDAKKINSDFYYPDTSSPALHVFWWLTWIVSNILANIGSRLVFSSNDGDIQNIGTAIVVLAGIASSVSAILLIKVVKNITGRQEASGSQISVQTPPTPPTFN